MNMDASIRYLSPLQSAELVLRLTEKMLHYADQHEWVITQSLEAERNQVLQNLFNHPEFDRLLPILAKTLQKVMDYDARVIEQGEAQLLKLTREMSQANHSRRAMSAYQDSMR